MPKPLRRTPGRPDRSPTTRPAPGTATLSDVAEAARVTPAVVSRVLNDDATLRVRAETRARVIEAADALHYTPHTSARALRTATSGAICLVVYDIANPIHAATLQGAQESARRADRVVLLAEAEEFDRDPDQLRNLVDSRRVDGLVLHRLRVEGDVTLQRAAESPMPTVLVNSRAVGAAGAVSLDDQAAARLATEHLLDLGHERIGLVSGMAGSDRSERRQQGVELALAARGLAIRDGWQVEGGFDAAQGRTGAMALLSQAARPSAIVVANVMAALGVLTACRQCGVKVPEEMSVIALLDAWLCEHTDPPLTVVDLPIREMGTRAVELLLAMIDGAPPEDVIVREPPPRLIVRGSTAPPAGT